MMALENHFCNKIAMGFLPKGLWIAGAIPLVKAPRFYGKYEGGIKKNVNGKKGLKIK